MTASVRCPTCKQTVPPDRLEFRPFCSRRCKMIDLGRWLDGSYAIPGEPADEEDLAGEEDRTDPEPRKR